MSHLSPTIVVCLCAVACNATPPRSVVVRAGRLIDGSGAPARERLRVRITDGVIETVEPDDDSPMPDGTAVVDARALTVLPGFVDAHTHLFSSGSCNPQVRPGALQAVRNLHALLKAGVTTVADLGAPPAFAVALRQHVGTARHRGPRVFVAGPLLTAPGGYPIDLLGENAVTNDIVRQVGSPEQAVMAVREVAVLGVDFVKVALDERSFNGQPIPSLSSATLCALVKEAKRQELRVLAHATTHAGYEAAVTCGVDGLMHGSLEPLDDPLVSRLKEHGLVVAPTLFVFEAPLWGPKHLERLDDPAIEEQIGQETVANLRQYAADDAVSGDELPPYLMPHISRRRAVEAIATNVENTRKLHLAGVPIGLGTDSAICFNLLGSPVYELERLAAAGLSPLEVLAAASQGGARLLNLEDAIGRLQVGYRADLVAVAGRPDERLADVTRVELVLIDGVVQRLTTPSLGEEIEVLWRFMWAELLR
jgi:imidazolonepropionase-like amidohydrolase